MFQTLEAGFQPLEKPALPRHPLFATVETMKSKIMRCSVLFALLFAATARGADDPPKGKQRQGSRILPLDELFAELDTNHDSKISKEEASGPYAQRFAKWNADGDAFITRQELRDYRLRFGINDDGTRATSQRRSRQRKAVPTATVLKEPTDWRLEIISIPPGFAPDIELKGLEEIRFAPGMFDTASSNYFTCVISLLLDQEPTVGAAELKEFLEKYYRGLSLGVGRKKGFSPDVAQMQAEVASIQSDTANRFTGHMVFFDSFSDGRKIRLNVEARVIPLVATKQTCVILLVSPSDTKKPIWKTLREIGKKTAGNVPGKSAGPRI